jgi:hypothetical protein
VNIIRLLRRERETDKWEASVKSEADAYLRRLEWKRKHMAMRPAKYSEEQWETAWDEVMRERGEPTDV